MPESRAAVSTQPRNEIIEGAPVRATLEQPEQPKAPLHSLSVSVPGEGDARTDIRFVHRNGALAMDVRTSNAHLSQQLKQELPQLLQSLEASGYRSDITPGAAADPARSLDAAPAEFITTTRVATTPSPGSDSTSDGEPGERGRSFEFDEENQRGRKHRAPLEEEDHDN
jgi:hypothetical protein